MNPKIWIVAIALALATTADAATLVDAPAISAQDRAAISKLEQQLFDDLARNGVEKTLSSNFPTVKDNPEFVRAMQSLDKDCGVVSTAERFSTKTFGSRAIREEFVVVMGSCLVKWDLTYLKVGVAWKLNNVHFESNEGSW